MFGNWNWDTMPTAILLKHRDHRAEAVRHLEGLGRLNVWEIKALEQNQRDLKAIHEKLARRNRLNR